MYQQIIQPNNEVQLLSQPSITDVVQVPQTSELSQPTQYPQKVAKSLGIIQMIVGITCFISNIVILTSARSLNTTSIFAYGIWGGILFFVAGLLETLFAIDTSSMRLLIGAMVLSIIAACVSGVVFSMGIIEAFLQNSSYNRTNSPHEVLLANIAFAIIMIISAFIEAVASITSSALRCRAFCPKLASNAHIPYYAVWNQPVTDYQPDQPPELPPRPTTAMVNNEPPDDGVYDEID